MLKKKKTSLSSIHSAKMPYEIFNLRKGALIAWIHNYNLNNIYVHLRPKNNAPGQKITGYDLFRNKEGF